MDLPGGTVVKKSCGFNPCAGKIPGLGRSPGVGNGKLIQYSCLEDSMKEKPGGLHKLDMIE